MLLAEETEGIQLSEHQYLIDVVASFFWLFYVVAELLFRLLSLYFTNKYTNKEGKEEEEGGVRKVEVEEVVSEENDHDKTSQM